MKLRFLVAFIGIVATHVWRAHAQTYDTNGGYVQTFAGSGFSGYVDGVGQLTMFNNPNAIVADTHGTLFVSDYGNYRIREIAPDGGVTTFAGAGNPAVSTNGNSNGGYYQGTGTNVIFPPFSALTIDFNNTLWASGINHFTEQEHLWKITSGAVATYTNVYSLIGQNGMMGVCADSVGNIYFSSGTDNKIYRYTTNGTFSVFAGSGNLGYADGYGIFTAFNNPTALVADTANNIYVWDSGNHLIRPLQAPG